LHPFDSAHLRDADIRQLHPCGRQSGSACTDADALVELYRQGDRFALTRAIEIRLKGAREGSAAYIYQEINGGRLAGIGPAPPPFTGWRELKTFRALPALQRARRS